VYITSKGIPKVSEYGKGGRRRFFLPPFFMLSGT